jgi:hypothetical protein
MIPALLLLVYILLSSICEFLIRLGCSLAASVAEAMHEVGARSGSRFPGPHGKGSDCCQNRPEQE